MKMRKIINLLIFIFTSSLIIGCGSEYGDVASQLPIPEVEEIKQETAIEDSVDEVFEEELNALEENDYSTGLAPNWRDNEIKIIDDKYRNFYEIFVYSFCDSDGDGIGDINGVISKLDYLNDGNDLTNEDLGITGIWLMPIMPSDSYHKYDVVDYMNVDSQYGDIEDMKHLLDECHKRGIKVIIDFPMNHSSSEHPWFKECVEYLQGLNSNQKPNSKECKYLVYYNFSTDNQGGYSQVADTEFYYESRFSYTMPDLNLENEDVKKEFEAIVDYWLEVGVDGFRLDAVSYYVTGRDDLNIEILTWFNSYVKDKKEDAYIVCENWSDQSTYSSYYSSGVDSLFDFAFANKDGIIAKTVNKSTKASAYGKALENEEKLYLSYSEDYINAPFYTNHDMARSAGYYSGDNSEAMTKLGNALNLIMSGNTFIYYGEEIGMKGSGIDENKRAPMYWSKNSSAEGRCVGPENMEAFDMKYDSLEEQITDDSSIYNYVKDCILIRNQIPAISHGNTKLIDTLSDDDVCILSKKYNDEKIYIVINTSSDKKEIDMSSLSGEPFNVLAELYAADNKVSRDGNCFNLPGYAIVILNNGDENVMTEVDDSEEEFLPGYDTEEDFKTRHTGSASLITDKTVIVSIFVDEPENVWDTNSKDVAYDIWCKAYNDLSKILMEEYDTSIDLVYDWKVNPDLLYAAKANEDIAPNVEGKDKEAYMDALEDEWISQVDYRSLLLKYDATSICFLYLINHEGVSYSSQHFIEDDMDTWNEGCLLYLQDYYSDTYEYETPTVYAHELLHVFGAEDFYSSAKVFSTSTYNKLKKLCSDDIMYTQYDMINGVYTTYSDGIHGTISPVTAYLLGIYDESAVDDLPELKKTEIGCFDGSNSDRPF